MGFVRTICVAVLAAVICPAAGLGAAPGLLKASRSSLTVQNRRADTDDLSRMRDRAMVRRFARAGLLARVPVRTRYYYLRYIPSSYRYIRPWSKLFLDRLSRQYYARFKKKVRVTSLVRTVGLQKALRRRNANAAPAYGARRSPHLTGATLDISKKGMTGKELAWMRRVLSSLKTKKYLYAVEEFGQPTFHIMVHKNYPKYVKGLQRRARR
jgi:hypothetical protein